MADIRKKGLGRGLDAILADSGYQNDDNGVKTLKIGEIEPNRSQPRKDFSPEELEELAESIKKYGVMSPIIVKKSDDGYTIIAGERRWRAARIAELNEVPVIIKDVDELTAAEMAIVENIQRTDLNPVEEANAYKILTDEYGLTQEEIAEKIGKRRSSVANSMRLLDLSDVALSLLSQGKISSGHAKLLLGLRDSSKMDEVAKEVAEKQLSVKETEALVKRANTPKKEKKPQDFDYTKALEESIQRKIGRTVKINNTGRKKSVSIGYSDNEDLEKLLKLICGEEFIKRI
ncbi:MAG: ParB/RepB/Spo0J family partition protein [Clostridiales bacterium]|nr:ParB/RepB/Spo0J family partition protein [Clostridiales bacterium]